MPTNSGLTRKTLITIPIAIAAMAIETIIGIIIISIFPTSGLSIKAPNSEASISLLFPLNLKDKLPPLPPATIDIIKATATHGQ